MAKISLNNQERLIHFFAVLFCIFLFLLSFHIWKITKEPEGKYLHSLEPQLTVLLWQMSQKAEEYHLYSKEEELNLQALRKQSGSLQSQANEIWSSIPPGEIIATTHAGVRRPVGKNTLVERLRKKVVTVESKISEENQALGIKYGPILEEKYSLDLWKNYQGVKSSINSHKQKYAWYYFGWQGSFVIFIHILSIVLMGVFVVLFVLSMCFLIIFFK